MSETIEGSCKSYKKAGTKSTLTEPRTRQFATALQSFGFPSKFTENRWESRPEQTERSKGLTSLNHCKINLVDLRKAERELYSRGNMKGTVLVSCVLQIRLGASQRIVSDAFIDLHASWEIAWNLRLVAQSWSNKRNTSLCTVGTGKIKLPGGTTQHDQMQLRANSQEPVEVAASLSETRGACAGASKPYSHESPLKLDGLTTWRHFPDQTLSR